MARQNGGVWGVLFMFVLAGMFAILMGAVIIFVSGCTVYPRTPAAIGPEYVPTPMAVIEKLPVQEGDDKLVQVSLGSMRNALAVAEAYPVAVASQNSAVKAAELLRLEHEHDRLLIEKAKEAGRLKTLSGFAVGALVGAGAVTITLLIAR